MIERLPQRKQRQTMRNSIEKIRKSLDNTLAAAEDTIYSIKTLYFFKGQSGVREYIKDKVSLATALSWFKGRSRKD